MSKRVLVTGANGFVGSFVTQELQRLGHHVVAVVRNEEAAQNFRKTQIKYKIVADSLLVDAWLPAMDGIDAVLHLAGRAHIMEDKHPDPLQAFREVNVEMTKALAQAAVACGVSRFIYASSVKVHDVDVRDTALEPMELLNPQDPYGRSKWEAENYLKEFGEQNKMQCALVRLPLIFGPGVKGNLARLLKMIERGIPMPLGAIHNQRSLVSLPNLASFFDVCLKHQDPSGVWMVEEAKPFSTTQMMRLMAQGMGKTPRLIPVPVLVLKALAAVTGKDAEIRRLTGSLTVNMAQTTQVLGWEPTIASETSFQKMAEWYLKQKS